MKEEQDRGVKVAVVILRKDMRGKYSRSVYLQLCNKEQERELIRPWKLMNKEEFDSIESAINGNDKSAA